MDGAVLLGGFRAAGRMAVIGCIGVEKVLDDRDSPDPAASRSTVT